MEPIYIGDEYLTPQEAGDEIGVTAERVRQLCNAGVLRSIRSVHGWRVLFREDVEGYLKKKKVLEAARAALRRVE